MLVQPEMERGRSPLVSIPPFGRGFSSHRYDRQAISQHGDVLAEPRFVSPAKIIIVMYSESALCQNQLSTI